MKTVLVTGSGGLVGSEAARFFHKKGFTVFGVDNDMRSYFFGKEGSTQWNVDSLKKEMPKYVHIKCDIRDKDKIEQIFKDNKFDIVIHCAAQPSHDWAAKEPITDFDINANGTLNLLEQFRRYSPKGAFVFTSTNKVYGDTPNSLPFVEKEKRFEIDPKHEFSKGIDESMRIDNSLHSIFGASKVAADILVQEYGKYFMLNTASFRAGCITGPAHSAAELHGFLAYLVKCIASEKPYTIYGYKGKQVRDNIHAHDLVRAFYEFSQKPRKGEVYNIGGGRESNISVLEAIERIEKILGKKAIVNYKDETRRGDHQWYISNVDKFKSHYPGWDYSYDIDDILKELCIAANSKVKT